MKYVTKDQVDDMINRGRLADPPAETRGRRSSIYEPLLRAVVSAAPRAWTTTVEDAGKAERIRAGLSTLASTHPELLGEGRKLRMSIAQSGDEVVFQAWLAPKAA